MTDEVINRLLEKKGVRPGTVMYDNEKEKVTEELEDTISSAMVRAMIEPERVEELRTMINGGADSEEIAEFIEKSEIDIRVVAEAIQQFEKEYFGENNREGEGR